MRSFFFSESWLNYQLKLSVNATFAYRKINTPATMTVLFFLIASGLNNTYSATVSQPGSHITPIEVWKYKRAREFIKLTAADINNLTGKIMNLLQRFSFFIMKKKMNRSLRKNPNLTVNEFLSAPHKVEIIWLIVIIALALLLLLVMIALLGGL